MGFVVLGGVNEVLCESIGDGGAELRLYEICLVKSEEIGRNTEA